MKEIYQQDGFVYLKGLISPHDCEILRSEADRLANGHYTNLLNVHENSKAFYDLLMDKVLLAIADEIQDHKMIPVGSILFFCKPGNDLEQGSNPHQDNYAAKAPYGSYLGIGIALEDADETNGALQVYPRSHKLGDIQANPSKNFEFDKSGKIIKAQPIGNCVITNDSWEKVQLRYPEGTAIFIHPQLVHYAEKNNHPTRWRRTVYLHYIKNEHPFWPGWTAKRKLMDRDKTFEEYKL